MLLAVFALLALANAQFNFNRIHETIPGIWGRVDSTIYKTVAPLAFTNAQFDVGIAPPGSWILYGTQRDVWISWTNGQTWTLLAGLNGNGLPDSTNVTMTMNGAGNLGCGHSTTFNRFYFMGETFSQFDGVPDTAFYANYVSTDGQKWTEIMEQASNDLMTARDATAYGICTVSKQEKVYSVGGRDTWESVDLGVSWQRVTSPTYFQLRQAFSGLMYTPIDNPTKEHIIIAGGRGWTPESPWGAPFNDVWMTSDYARTWTRQTAAAPWRTRENPQIVATKHGMLALNGGSLCSGSGCESTGPWALSGWVSDVWVSFNHGVNWQRVAETTGSLYALAATVLDSEGYWYTMCGQTGPANNTGYSWTSSMYKSTHSLHEIATWGPALGLTIPPGFGQATVPKVEICSA